LAPQVRWPDLYPAFLRVEGAPVLVVGAGSVGERKIAALVAAGARVTVVAPEAAAAVEALAGGGRVEWRRRGFAPADADGMALVLAATPHRDVNEAVYRAARERGIWVNVADDPALCTFHVPSVVDRAPLRIAISTSGACPAYARDLRRRIEAILDPALGGYVDLLGEVRAGIGGPDRSDAIRALVDSGAEERWVAGERDEARAILERAAGRR